MRRSKSRSSSVVFPATSSADFSSQRCIVYTDKHVPMPLLITAPCCSCPRNLAGTAMRPLASIVCSYSPRNMSVGLQFAVPPSLWPLAWVCPECSPSPWRGTPLRPTHRSTSPLPAKSSPQSPTSPHLIITLFFRMREGCYPPISERQVDNLWITCYKH